LTLPEIVAQVLERAKAPEDALSAILLAGYAPVDATGYTRKYVLLEEPAFFTLDVVPRVRQADEGVSQLRYVVTLDEAKRFDFNCDERVKALFGTRGEAT
jgi:hypothetical protein